MDCVVAIGVEYLPPGKRKPKTKWLATGFFYGYRQPDSSYATFLVTNRHVFEQLRKVHLEVPGVKLLVRVSVDDATTQDLQIAVFGSKGEQLWETHSNRKIDIAVTGFNYNILDKISKRASGQIFRSDQHVWRTKDIRDGLSPGDGLFVVGFPTSLLDVQSDGPVVRSAAIAKLGKATATTPILFDGFVFPGNSGGPVITKAEPSAVGNTKPVPNSNLIGIVASYVPYIDNAKSEQTGELVFTQYQNSGLSIAYSVDAIETTIRRYRRMQKRLIQSSQVNKVATRPDDTES
jgi:hypothetical protein